MKEKRLQCVIQNMKRDGILQMVISEPASIYYLTGIWIEPHERLWAMYLDAEGRTVLFGNEIFGITPSGIEYATHGDGDNPVRDLAKAVSAGKLGIDKFWASKFLIGLWELRQDIIPVVGSAPVDYARMFKDEEEIAAMRHASRINDEVVTAAIAALRDGVRENELASLVNKLYLERGADREGTQLVCFGKNGADPHHEGDSTVIAPGDSVIFDLFTPIRYYWCDMTRTVFYQSASKLQREVYQIVREANEAAEAAIRPEMKLSEIDGIARSIITKAGYGKYFTHRLGHNIGLCCHEPPDVSAASEMEVLPGMVFSIEPGIYLPGQFGVRIEDLVLVTETGVEVLNHAPKELQIVGQ